MLSLNACSIITCFIGPGWYESIRYEYTETYSKPCQTSKVERFFENAKWLKTLNIFSKCSSLDVCQGYEYGYSVKYHYFIIKMLSKERKNGVAEVVAPEYF